MLLQHLVFLFAFIAVFSVCCKSFPINVTAQIYSQVRVIHIIKAFLLLLGVAALFYITSLVPFLKVGWMHLIIPEGGSLLGGQMAVKYALSGNTVQFIQAFLFFILALYAMPAVAQTEEEIFRYKRITYKEIFIYSLGFGFAHCIIGLPLGIGIALSFLGLYFGLSYRKAYFKNLSKGVPEDASHKNALTVTTIQHATYNALIIVIVMSLCVHLLFKYYG